MEASDMGADSMLPQEVLVGPAPFCRRLVASHGPWPQYATCKAGAKMLAYLACVSKIVMGLKNETAKAVTLTRRGCGRPARALLAGRWAIPGGAGKPRRCCRGPGCFPSITSSSVQASMLHPCSSSLRAWSARTRSDAPHFTSSRPDGPQLLSRGSKWGAKGSHARPNVCSGFL